MAKLIIIFSGYNQRAVIAFLRTLYENQIDNYGIIAASEEDTILYTRYAKKVAYIRKNKQLCLEEVCFAIKHLYEIYNEKECVIIPSTEALNRFLLTNRQILYKQGCDIPLVNEKLYEEISDKEKFWKICRENNLCTPNLICLQDTYKQPFVAKPKKYFSTKGEVYSPIIIENEIEFSEFKEKYYEEDFTYQEYIEGKSYYLLFYFTQKGRVYKFSQENYAQQAGGKSILAAGCSNLHLDSFITCKYEELFLKMGYYGFVMVELRKNREQYYMIEANPRLWGPSQLFCDAGYNLFEAFLNEYGFIDKIPERKINSEEKYLWSGGAKGTLLEDKSCMWFGNGKIQVKENWQLFLKNDIYRREDTLNIFKREREVENGKKF